jgi:hypothetical protein
VKLPTPSPESPAVLTDVSPPGALPTAAGIDFQAEVHKHMDVLLDRPVHGIEVAGGVVNGKGTVEGQVSVETKKAGTFAVWGRVATDAGYAVMAKWRKTFGGGR